MATIDPTAAADASEPKTVPSAPPDARNKVAVVTLDELAREMKLPPRDARMLLRLAAKQPRIYPNLGKDHIARQPWQWTPGSKALNEARKALKADID